MKIIFALQIVGSSALAQPHDLQVLMKFLEKGRISAVESTTGDFQKNISLDKNTNPEKPSDSSNIQKTNTQPD